MRYLAVARFRLLTTIRSATPIFLVAAAPALIGALIESMPEPLYRSEADGMMRVTAIASVFAWLFHSFVMLMSCEAFGNLRLLRPDLTSLPSDLMDSAPIGPTERFWGEALGIFAATLIIHVCCLPLLAADAALSPLPIGLFLWMEAGLVGMLILASASAAWKRLAPRTKMSATRTMRSGLLFFILVLILFSATTNWVAFRDALAEFAGGPSMNSWARVTATVENPLLLLLLFSLLYASYLFYYVVSTRKPVQA